MLPIAFWTDETDTPVGSRWTAVLSLTSLSIEVRLSNSGLKVVALLPKVSARALLLSTSGSAHLPLFRMVNTAIQEESERRAARSVHCGAEGTFWAGSSEPYLRIITSSPGVILHFLFCVSFGRL